MGLCQSCESGIRSAGGGGMLDKAKARLNDGVEIAYGKEKAVPEVACKGVGAAHVGISYVSKAGTRVDAEFAALEFDKDGTKLDWATYNHRESKDGALKHLGDSTGAEGAEYIAVSLGSLADEVQAVIFCCYVFNVRAHDVSAFESVKLVLKGAAGETVVPVGFMQIDPAKCGKGVTGMTLAALYRAPAEETPEEATKAAEEPAEAAAAPPASGEAKKTTTTTKWMAKNVFSEGAGPANDDMLPACEKLFAELGIGTAAAAAAAKDTTAPKEETRAEAPPEPAATTDA